MKKAKNIFIRLSTSDIVLSKEEEAKIPSYITITDKDGEYLTEVEVYGIGYEDEEGNECEEDGTYLN